MADLQNFFTPVGQPWSKDLDLCHLLPKGKHSKNKFTYTIKFTYTQRKQNYYKYYNRFPSSRGPLKTAKSSLH